jgi:hypothetical protein
MTADGVYKLLQVYAEKIGLTGIERLGVHALRATAAPMPSIIRRILPKSRSGLDMRISQPPGCMTAGNTGRRTHQRLKWNINREWVTDLSSPRQHILDPRGECFWVG